MVAPTTASMSSESQLFAEVATIARTLAARVVPADAVDDLVQEVVLRCLVEHRAGRAIDRDRLPGLVKMLVFVCTTHESQRTRRRGERDALHEQEMRASEHVWMSPDLAIEQQELENVYQRALDALPRACRRAYTLVRDEALTYEQAAARLGVSRATVCFHVVTAQSRLRDALREHGVVVPAPKRGGRGASAAGGAGRSKRSGGPDLRLVTGDDASPPATTRDVGTATRRTVRIHP